MDKKYSFLNTYLFNAVVDKIFSWLLRTHAYLFPHLVSQCLAITNLLFVLDLPATHISLAIATHCMAFVGRFSYLTYFPDSYCHEDQHSMHFIVEQFTVWIYYILCPHSWHDPIWYYELCCGKHYTSLVWTYICLWSLGNIDRCGIAGSQSNCS